eukprot:7407_1
MSLTMDEKQDKNNKKLTQKWCRASFIFENLSDPNNTKITFDLNKTSNVLRIKQESDDADAVKERSYALKGKKSTLNVNELSASSDPSQTASISSTNQAMNRRQSGKDVAVTIDDEHIIGDHITIAISSKGMNLFWEENRSAAYHIALDVSNSWLISFSGDEYASIAQSQFFSCSLLKQFPTFMELNLYLSKLPDFEDKELELENKLKETEQQVTKFKEISENRATKLKTAAATAIALRDKLKETQCVAARMHQDIQLIKQVAPKAFDRVAMHHKGVKLEPEPQNVMISQSKTKATTPAAAAASPNAAPIPKKGGAPMPAPLPGAAPLPGGAPMPAPLPGAAPLPGGLTAAPLPGGAAPIPAPMPGAAPLPGGAAPLPGGAAPIPMGAPIPGGAPIPMMGGAPIPCGAPIPGGMGGAPIPMMGGAPIPGMMGGAPIPMMGGAPVPMMGGAPIPGMMGGMMGAPLLGPPGIGMKRKKAMAKKKKQQPTIKMKTLHWKPISDKKIPGTIWEDITKL